MRHPASGYVQGINDLVTPFFIVFLSYYICESSTVVLFARLFHSRRQRSRDIRRVVAVSRSLQDDRGRQLLVSAKVAGGDPGQLHSGPTRHPDKDTATERPREATRRLANGDARMRLTLSLYSIPRPTSLCQFHRLLAVCLSVDEQLVDERVPAALRRTSLGLVPRQ